MLFKLKRPWIEWIIKTEIGNQIFDAKIDTGAFITLIGVDVAVELGLTIDLIKRNKCVRYSGVVEESKGYAFKVPCTSLPLGNMIVPITEIYVPFAFIDKEKYRFISEDRFLIGTDILNNYNFSIIFDKKPDGYTVDSVSLELLPHSFKLQTRPSPTYTLGQMANTVDELMINIDDSLVQEVPVDYKYS